MAIPAAAAETTESIASTLKPAKDGNVYVAFVIGQTHNVMDLAGPWETFQDVNVSGHRDGYDSPFKLMTVAETSAPIEASGGLLIKPNYTFETLPVQPNVIVIGDQQDHTKKKIAWIRKTAENADVVMSVCTGAFLLAKTGLLDGLRATTHHNFYDDFEKGFPKVHLVRGPRYVDNGKIATAGGLTSGIELALAVVQRYFGGAVASEDAYFMEYVRSPKRPPIATG
jgi:transcriptional regulator GlxA family with amidase domain